MPPIALRLRTLFWLISFVILLSSTLLAFAPSIESSWERVAQNRQTVRRVALLDAGIKAAWRISAERGPTNGLMGADGDEQAVWRARLGAQRAASNRALAHLRDLLSQDGAAQQAQALTVVHVMNDLSAQRAQIDRFAALPLLRRDPPIMAQRVDGMIALVAPLAGINVRIGADIVRHDRSQADDVVIALLAAELREYVGQAGSRVAVGLFRQQGLSAPERRVIDQLKGRVDELQFLMETRLASHAEETSVPALKSVAITQDLAASATLVEQALVTMQASGAAGSVARLTPGQFTDRYVPKMAPIETLPDLVLFEATHRAEYSHRQAILWMWITSAAIASLLGVVTITGVFLNRFVIQPLVAVTAHIRAIVAKCEPANPVRRTRGEIADLLHASAVLRRANRRRLRLEREREELLHQLSRLADTDHLTGLLNRRAFNADGLRALTAGREIAVLLCDVDHFKEVNDRLGHAAGDQVLLLVAQRLSDALRTSDTLYRYGGEEFAVIIETSQRDHTPPHLVAQRLCETLEAAAFSVGTGTLRVTVSIGVSCSILGDDLTTLLERADRALYRAKHDGRNCVRPIFT